MRAVGLKILKNKLSEYVRLAASGETVLVTDREFQVMRMLASGLSVAEIAAALSLHVRTVGTFRRHILRKLNLKSTQAIAYYAIRGGLVDLPPSN